METLINLSNKTILITGASSGIGKAIAITLAKLNANIIITGRDQQRLDLTLKEIVNYNVNNKAIKADMLEDDSIDNLVKELVPLDGVVFCAGIIEYAPVKLVTHERIKNIFSINFDSQVLLTQKLLQLKKIKNNSSLVYISSISEKLGIKGTAIYSASKAALSAFARVLANELASKKITVNTLCPGIVRTPMSKEIESVITSEKYDESEIQYPLGYGTDVDVANFVGFLLSDKSRWITGSSYTIDGGLVLN